MLLVRCAIAAVISTATPLAAAQPLDTYTYQGQLKLDGAPATGSFDMTFTVFPAETGGIAAASDTLNDVEVTDGLFTVKLELDERAFTQGEPRWIEIGVRDSRSVGGFATLRPRQCLTRAPFATHSTQADTATSADTALLADSALLADVAAATDATLQDIFSNGNDIFIPDNSFSGGLNVGRANNPLHTARFLESSVSESLAFLLSQGTSPHAFGVQLSTSATTNENRISAARDLNGNFGFSYRGVDSESFLEVRGSTSLFQIDTDDINPNNRAILPSASVSPVETSAEAGVVSATNTGFVSVIANSSSSPSIIVSRTINAPADGFVLVIATGEATIEKAAGTFGSATFGVSDTTGSMPSNQDVEWRLNSSLPAGFYDIPVTVHGLFEVSDGSNTFYFSAFESSSNLSTTVIDSQLTCVFIPTAYGSVTPTLSAGSGFPDAPMTRPPLSQADLDAELLQSILDNQARIEAENAEMRARLEALEANEAALIGQR